MVAFFPLFPFLWKLLHVGPIGISIVNGLIFIFSLAWLASAYNIQTRKLLLLASIPSILFMFLPFSEALFFLSSVLLLIGLKKEIFSLVITGIIFSGLSRPVASVFIPAIIILHYFTGDNSKQKIFQTLWMVVACAGSMLAVFVLQYVQTGEWLSFIHIQKDWGNYLRMPVIPLNSWAGGFIVRLDAIAFFFGIASAVMLGYILSGKSKIKINFDRPLVFSLCYLSILSIIILFTRGGVLNSLNRYLFCSAFFFITLDNALQKIVFSKKNILLLFFASGIFWLLFASYVHIQTILKFELLTLYLIMLLAINAENKFWKNTGYYSILACNIIFLMIFMQRFLSGAWVA